MPRYTVLVIFQLNGLKDLKTFDIILLISFQNYLIEKVYTLRLNIICTVQVFVQFYSIIHYINKHTNFLLYEYCIRVQSIVHGTRTPNKLINNTVHKHSIIIYTRQYSYVIVDNSNNELAFVHFTKFYTLYLNSKKYLGGL